MHNDAQLIPAKSPQGFSASDRWKTHSHDYRYHLPCSHSDLWRAIREQLIERYTRDPGADGFGVYLVFWFGGEGMPLPQEGKKPRNATELEQRLHSMLTREEARHITVCVIDRARP